MSGDAHCGGGGYPLQEPDEAITLSIGSYTAPEARLALPQPCWYTAAMMLTSVLLLAASAAALSAPETVHQALRSRRTTHNFQRGQPVGEDILRRAVEAATMAPNHKLTEPWLFRRLGRESIEAIATLNAAAIADPDKAKAKAARWAAIENWLVAASDNRREVRCRRAS